jgi:hypothetical protein
MKALLIIAAALSFAAPAMAGTSDEPRPDKDAIREAKEAADQAKRCDEALERYAEHGNNWFEVVRDCGL